MTKNKGDIVSRCGADRIWNNNIDAVIKDVHDKICRQCRPEICSTPCSKAHNTVTDTMWKVLGFYAKLN